MWERISSNLQVTILSILEEECESYCLDNDMERKKVARIVSTQLANYLSLEFNKWLDSWKNDFKF